MFLASLQPTNNEIGEIETIRITNTSQIHHYSPNIDLSESDELIIYYIFENQNEGEIKLVENNPGKLTTTNTQTNSEIITKSETLRTFLSTNSILFGLTFITLIVIFDRRSRK